MKLVVLIKSKYLNPDQRRAQKPDFWRALGLFLAERGVHAISKLEGFPKGLDTENCELIRLDEDCAYFKCGGDWQDPVTVGIVFAKTKKQKLEIGSLYDSISPQSAKDLRAANKEMYELADVFKNGWNQLIIGLRGYARKFGLDETNQSILAELSLGIEDEKEHTLLDTEEKRAEVAAEHLKEDKHYYSKLRAAGLMDKPKLEKSFHKLAGYTTFQGLKIAIENKKGSIRSGVDCDGKPWSIKMRYAYGYVRFTKASDGDAVDVYLGPNKNSTKVFVIHQNDPVTGLYDEEKCMLGFDSAREAKKAYMGQYNRPGFYGGMDEMNIHEFAEKVKTYKLTGYRKQK